MIAVVVDRALIAVQCATCLSAVERRERFVHRPTSWSCVFLVECIACALRRFGLEVTENDLVDLTTANEIANEGRWREGAAADHVQRESEGHPF